MELVGILLTNDVASTVTFPAGLGYEFPDGSAENALFGSANLGYPQDMTRDSFCLFEYSRVAIPIRLTNLESFTVDIEPDASAFRNSNHNGALYYYHWSNGSVVERQFSTTVSSPPNEFTSSGFLILNEWYLVQRYPARFTINAGGTSGVYTEYGFQPSAALAIAGGGVGSAPGITVSAAQGTLVQIEKSSNLLSWDGFQNWHSSNTTNLTIPLDTLSPQQFFRAKAY